jgi:hypothetical protein
MRVQIKSDRGGNSQVSRGNLKGVLLSALVIASLLTSALTLTNTSDAKVYSNVDNIFVRGKDTAYGNNLGNLQPFELYALGDRPPVMMAQRIGSGAVIAMGSASTCRGGVTYTPQRWVSGELNVLLDKMFEWMVPGATKVLWYGDADGSGYEALYNDANCCSLLIDSLETMGYTVDNTIDSVFTEITPQLLSPYDILVIPQLQLGEPYSGGDPSQLPNNVVQVIDNFVKGGKGLLIMDSANYLGYNSCNVSNKILRSLNFCSRGGNTYFGFQSDAVYDDSYNHEGGNYWPTLDVDNTTQIGSAYQVASGKTTVDIYSPCSLVEENFGVQVSILPTSISRGPGDELNFSITVKNNGTSTDTFALTASDTRGWGPSLSSPSATLAGGDSRTDIRLSIKIPSTATNGTSTTITVKATSVGYDTSATCTAIATKATTPSGGISPIVYVGVAVVIVVVIAAVLILKVV